MKYTIQIFMVDCSNVFIIIQKRYMLKEEGVKPPSQVLTTNLTTKSDLVARKNYIHWLFADVSWAVTSYLIYYYYFKHT